MIKPAPLPFRTDFGASTHALSLARAVVGLGRYQHGTEAVEFIKANWDDAHAVSIVQKGATTITSTSTATALKFTAISTLVDIMGSDKAFAAVASRAIPVRFENYNAITVPGISADASGVTFVSESNPLQVRQFDLSGAMTLASGKKLGLISTFTREVIVHTNADQIVRAIIGEDLARGLETLFFDAAETDGVRPSGIRFGVDKTTADTGTGLAAMTADLSTLAGKVASIGGDIIFIMSPRDTVKVKILAPLFSYPVFPSSGVADGTIICLAPRALCIAGSADAPSIDVSHEAVLHMEQTTPLALTQAGTPPLASYPQRSVFQTDCVALRVIANDVNWGWRGAGCAWTDSIAW